MACNKSIRAASKTVRPVMSTNFCEARRRALGLYRAVYRYIPYIVKYHDVPKNEEDCRLKLRAYFYKNAHVKDIRVIDVLVIKGFMELKEIEQQWQQKGHIMAHWQPTAEPKPCGFIAKFLAGND